MTYAELLLEYKRSETPLRERISALDGLMRTAVSTSELEALRRRKELLEKELYDLLDVINSICDYAGCGAEDIRRNA